MLATGIPPQLLEKRCATIIPESPYINFGKSCSRSIKMRLICTKKLRLTNVKDPNPQYAILSHTWARGGHGEVRMRDFQNIQKRQRMKGFEKIQSACVQAQKDNLQYLWVDTCCIDHKNPTELAMSIRSMFRWYKNAKTCYALLEDVYSSDINSLYKTGSLFAKSRWFTRGWTLQELIAPQNVRFFNKYWSEIGEKEQLAPLLESITNINEEVLRGGDLHRISIGRRMSWASYRQTTLVEDIAYCLMGIFDVNMTMDYGEGSRAFIRLQEEILKRSADQSLLAWRKIDTPALSTMSSGLLAESPRDFANFRSQGDIILPFPKQSNPEDSFLLTNRGIELKSVIKDLRPQQPGEFIMLGLNCSNGQQNNSRIGIYLHRYFGHSNLYSRVLPWELGICAPHRPMRESIYGIGSFKNKLGYGHLERNQPDFYRIWTSRHKGTMNGVAPGNDCQHCFYIQNLVIDAWWDKYFPSVAYFFDSFDNITKVMVFPTSTPDRPPGMSFRTNWKDRTSEFRMLIIWSSKNGPDALMVWLGAGWGKTGSAYSFWFDSLSIPDKRLVNQVNIATAFSFPKPRRWAICQQKSVSVGDIGKKLLISVRSRKIRGFDMFAVELSGKPS